MMKTPTMSNTKEKILESDEECIEYNRENK